MSLQEISNTLWRQRNLLEMLMFKLEEEQLLLAAGRTRWITAATREVEQVLEEIRATEVIRSALVDAIAPELGLAPNPSLRDLTVASPEPWSSLLDEHRRAFLTLTEETLAVAKSNRELLARGAAAAREMLLLAMDPSGHGRAEDRMGTYDATGTVIALTRGGLLLDEAL